VKRPDDVWSSDALNRMASLCDVAAALAAATSKEDLARLAQLLASVLRLAAIPSQQRKS